MKTGFVLLLMVAGLFSGLGCASVKPAQAQTPPAAVATNAPPTRLAWVEKIKDWWNTPPPDHPVGKVDSKSDSDWYLFGCLCQILGTFLVR